MHAHEEDEVEPRFTSDPDTYRKLRDAEHEARERGEPLLDDEGEELPPVAMKPPRDEDVEEASWESFPASDPPSWSGGSVT